MDTNFDAVLDLVLKEEGGYTNDAADPGGPTNWGITIKDARLYWKANATAADVKAMPLSAAKLIYRKEYWNAMQCDMLPNGIDYSIMDYGVNSGIGRAGKVLRRALGLSDNVSSINQSVLDACAKADKVKVINYINSERLAFLQSLKTWKDFGRGWGPRVARVKARSLAMASNQPAVIPTTQVGRAGKGVVPVAKKTQTGTTGAVVISGTSMATSSHDIVTAVVIVAITLVIAVGCYFFFHWKQKRDQEASIAVAVAA